MSSDEECVDVSSDSNLELSDVENLDYLHEKIGIYVKDHSGSSQDKSQLVQLLPAEFSVVIVSYSDEERCDKVPGFSCTLRLSIWDKETILRWLKLFEQKTFTVWRVDSTFKCEKSKKLVFKKNFRCQNNQYKHPNRNKENTRKKRVEDTACPAKISLTIKNHGMQRTSDAYLKEYPAVINIRFTHNHTFRTQKEYLRDLKPKRLTIPELKPFEDNYISDVGSDVQLTNEEIENNEITAGETEDKKCVVTNSNWNDIICEDVFDDRTTQSLCLGKDDENINQCSEITPSLDKICDTLKQKLIEKPELYHLPVLNFIEKFDKMKSDSQLIAALNSFGISNSMTEDYKKETSIHVDNSNLVNVVIQPSNKVYSQTYKMETDDRIYVSTSEHPYFRLT